MHGPSPRSKPRCASQARSAEVVSAASARREEAGAVAASAQLAIVNADDTAWGTMSAAASQPTVLDLGHGAVEGVAQACCELLIALRRI